MQQPNLSRTPLSIALVASMLLATSIAQAAPVALNIPAQALASALNELGKQANLQILYSPDQVQGIKSRSVSGSLEPVKALESLLQGSGIAWQLNGDTVILNAPQGKGLELGATNITGQGRATC